MNILCINPPFMGRFSRTSRSPAVTKGGTLYYPIWLAYAVGALEQAGHDLRLIDAPADDLDLDDIFDRLNGILPEMVVVDTSTPSIYHDIQVAERIREKYPSAFIVFVGTHPSSLPEETLNLSGSINAIAVGEYDFTLRDLASALESNSLLDTVKGLVFRRGEKIVRNGERQKIVELDDLPFVSSVYKNHLQYRNYFFAAANYPMVMTITGRGCPYKCFFCLYPQVFHGRRYRIRSAENVVNEFEYILGNFPGIEEIGIEDDCFTANRAHARGICELLIKRGIKIKWYCNVRGDVDYDLLKLMKEAGCRLVTVGFESGSQHILDNMHKGEKIERYYQFAKDTKRAGLLVHGCIMVGNPGDTRETVEESYEFSKRINCDSMQFYPLYVYPGTEAFNWARNNGYLQTNDFSRWLTKEGLHNCVLNTSELSSEEMVSLCDYYLKKYHLRPGYLLSKFCQAVIHPSEGYRTCMSAKVFFFKILKGQLAGTN